MIGDAAHALNAMLFLIVSAVVLVILGLVFFLINLWIIAYSAEILFNAKIFSAMPSSEFVVLSASLLSAASMIGSKHVKK